MLASAVIERMEPLQGFATLGARELARLTDTAERTARRWIRNGLAPRLILRMLRTLLDGALAEIHPRWDGWTLRRDGKLHSPEGPAFTPDEIRLLPLRLQQLRALERERERDAERQAQCEIEPQRQQPTGGRSDLFDNARSIRREHMSPALAEAPVFPARRNPTPFSLCHVSCPCCETSFALTFSVAPVLALAAAPHPPPPAGKRSPPLLLQHMAPPTQSAHRAPSLAVPAPAYASDP